MKNHLQRPKREGAFIRVEVLLLLILLPIAGYLFLSAEQKRLRDARRLAGPRGSLREHEHQRRRDFFRLIAATGFIILALARPAWNEVPVGSWREGRDLVFLLDVSRSMLAGDLSPNRLEAAKNAIRDCVETLEGDRVGLVVFAGSASILCPLTNDYAFFFDKLGEAHPDFVAPGDVRVGGTRIGDAIHKICDKLLTHERRGYQDLILLSDGGDQDSNPLRAAKRLETLGVHFLVVGMGDSITGARVPTRGDDSEAEFTLFEGREVWSRLEADSLDTLAKSCLHGVFLNAGTRALPLGEIYQKLAQHFQRHPTGNREAMMRKQETFPLFLGIALFFLAAPPLRSRRQAGSAAALLLITGMVLAPAPAEAESGRSLFRSGVKQLTAKNYAVSIATFRQAAEAFPDSERSAVALYNAGLACYQQARVDEELDPLSSQTYYHQACSSFRAALEMTPTLDDARWNLELALRRLSLLSREINERDKDQEDSSEESEQDPQESEESEPSDEEGEWEESEEEGASQPSDQMDGQNAMNLDAQDIPPPMVEPEDIFRQEQENNEVRQKNSASNYQAVEKDW